MARAGQGDKGAGLGEHCTRMGFTSSQDGPRRLSVQAQSGAGQAGDRWGLAVSVSEHGNVLPYP